MSAARRPRRHGCKNAALQCPTRLRSIGIASSWIGISTQATARRAWAIEMGTTFKDARQVAPLPANGSRVIGRRARLAIAASLLILLVASRFEVVAGPSLAPSVTVEKYPAYERGYALRVGDLNADGSRCAAGPREGEPWCGTAVGACASAVCVCCAATEAAWVPGGGTWWNLSSVAGGSEVLTRLIGVRYNDHAF